MDCLIDYLPNEILEIVMNFAGHDFVRYVSKRWYRVAGFVWCRGCEKYVMKFGSKLWKTCNVDTVCHRHKIDDVEINEVPYVCVDDVRYYFGCDLVYKKKDGEYLEEPAITILSNRCVLDLNERVLKIEDGLLGIVCWECDRAKICNGTIIGGGNGIYVGGCGNVNIVKMKFILV